jgi:AraC-like DNA-binding protein
MNYSRKSTDCILRVGPLSNIPSLLRSFGCDPEAVLKSAGFSLRQFEDTESTISYVAASRLLARCVEVTNCDHFGLLLGEMALPSHLGISGFMLITAADVTAALESLSMYMDLHDQGGAPTFVTSDNCVMLGYAIHEQGTLVPEQVYDMSIAVSCRIMRSLCGTKWTPKEILLSRSAPRDVAPYKRFFRAPVCFNSGENALVFAVRWLNHKLPFSDPFLNHYLESKAKEMHVTRHQDLVGHLRYLLKHNIAAHDFTVAAIARRLGMHERTLNRRLNGKGTTFRRELDHVRQATSEQLLSATSMEIWRIAGVLGYGSTSSFNHAFRRWHSTNPENWRLQNSDK